MNKKEKIIFLICLAVFLAAGAFFAAYTIVQKQNEKVYEELPNPEPQEKEPEVTAALEPVEKPEVTKEPVEIPVDFEKLWEVNRDIYAWLEIPGTVVNYPIVQHESDDLYYLDHTIEKASGLPGSIYTESYNVKDFSDCLSVIYGHNMRNGSMFGSLSNYADLKHGEKFSYVKIYTPEKILTYQVFAAVTYDNRHILANYGADDKMGIQSFLNSLEDDKISGWVDEKKEVDADDQIIVMSTCNNHDEQRFLVGAVLIDEE